MIAMADSGGHAMSSRAKAQLFANCVQALARLEVFWCNVCVKAVDPVPLCGRLACPMCKKPNTLVLCVP